MKRSFAFRVRVLIVLALVLAGALVLLYHVSPEQEGFYPRCWLNKYTGIHCAGCGTTRCLHALLHGDLVQAAAWNPLTLLLLPLLLWTGYRKASDYLSDDPPPEPRRRGPWMAVALGVLIITFSVVRNIRAEPWSWLAPHKIERSTTGE